jgi:hypothetical protein
MFPGVNFDRQLKKEADMNFKFFTMTLSICTALVSFNANANLITNGDFESGNLTGGVSGGFGPFLTFTSGSTAIDGWVVGEGGVNLWTDYKGTGNHVIDIIGDIVDGGGSLTQSFSTVAGQQYSISFDLSGANDPNLTSTNNPVKQMDVTAYGSDSVTVLTTNELTQNTSGWDGNFIPVTMSFVADGSQSTIKFVGLNSGWNGFYIDNVNVSAVPLPAAIWLFGSGLIGLIGISGRKKYN